FQIGTKVQLKSGTLKNIEQLTTRDFVDDSNFKDLDLNLRKMFVMHMKENHEMNSVMLGFAIVEENVQMTVEARVEHPFFLLNRGWASYSPDETWNKFGMTCERLQVGNCCLGL
ncbi:hypothetical protein HELRODRAFT_136991, partial [Helobdella robusta]|uniref:AXH domain-containing protein n=1 Tax=Helobdella robusta TaxID=6412 RepID=T1EIH0_HELRO